MVEQACLDIVGCDGDDVAVAGNQSSQVKARLLLRSNTVMDESMKWPGG